MEKIIKTLTNDLGEKVEIEITGISLYGFEENELKVSGSIWTDNWTGFTISDNDLLEGTEKIKITQGEYVNLVGVK